MSEDRLSEIDSILSEELPDFEKDSDTPIDNKKREDLIELLQHAADKLGKSPTVREFNSLNLEVSSGVFKYTFGTWNEAKEAAGLEKLQRGKQAVRGINETYFKSIDSAEKAYWFGTLDATSSLQRQELGENYALSVGRTENKAYFVTEFVDAIESDHSINWNQGSKSNNRQAHVLITNPTFVEHLLDAGYPGPESDSVEFPPIDNKYRSPFLRGFLESSGYFTTQGWRVVTDNIQRGETLQAWFEQLGAKRATVSQPSRGTVVNVSNIFDIKAIFESLWPDILETNPSWKPYPRKILQYLESEYPYPENLSYLDG